jgi:hypothetical protein
MRAELLALARKSPHPAVPATFSPREKERRPRRACNSTAKRARLLKSNCVLRGKERPRIRSQLVPKPSLTLALMIFPVLAGWSRPV